MVGSTKCSIYDKQSLGIVQFHYQKVANLNQLFQQVSETGGSLGVSLSENSYWFIIFPILEGSSEVSCIFKQTEISYCWWHSMYIYIYIHIPMTFPNCFFRERMKPPCLKAFEEKIRAGLEYHVLSSTYWLLNQNPQ